MLADRSVGISEFLYPFLDCVELSVELSVLIVSFLKCLLEFRFLVLEPIDSFSKFQDSVLQES
jgi:hypothetical protein